MDAKHWIPRRFEVISRFYLSLVLDFHQTRSRANTISASSHDTLNCAVLRFCIDIWFSKLYTIYPTFQVIPAALPTSNTFLSYLYYGAVHSYLDWKWCVSCWYVLTLTEKCHISRWYVHTLTEKYHISCWHVLTLTEKCHISCWHVLTLTEKCHQLLTCAYLDWEVSYQLLTCTYLDWEVPCQLLVLFHHVLDDLVLGFHHPAHLFLMFLAFWLQLKSDRGTLP